VTTSSIKINIPCDVSNPWHDLVCDLAHSFYNPCLRPKVVPLHPFSGAQFLGRSTFFFVIIRKRNPHTMAGHEIKSLHAAPHELDSSERGKGYSDDLALARLGKKQVLRVSDKQAARRSIVN
jgi:hypothetical protein